MCAVAGPLHIEPFRSATRDVPAMLDVSVVMPCLNEESTVGECVRKAKAALASMGVDGEVIVADNGSTDHSVEIATALGARVVHQPQGGYGNAYLAGLAAARGHFIVMGDSDNTYDFAEVPRFVQLLREGRYDLVNGTRLGGTVKAGAMPFLHRYVGTPVLTALVNLFSGAHISDTQSGMRAFTQEAYRRLNLHAGGMEFVAEMIVEAARARLRITEIPITYYPREGESKLRTFHDGWRNLRMLLLHSPTHLFLLPGAALLLVGLALLGVLSFGPLRLSAWLLLDLHSLIAGSLAAILGFQVVCLGLYAKAYAWRAGLGGGDRVSQRLLQSFTLERGLVGGGATTLLGLSLLAYVVFEWISNGLVLAGNPRFRPALWGLTLTVLGVQAVFASFFLALLEVPDR